MNILYPLPRPQRKLNYFLTYILVAFSGINFFLGDRYMLVGFLIVTTIFIIKKIKIDKFLLLFLSAFLILFILQYIDTKILLYKTQIGFFIRILNAYFIIKIIGKDFLKYYVNLLIIFSLISFVFYIPILISPRFEQILVDKVTPHFAHYDWSTEIYSAPPQFIVFTINSDRRNNIIPRNSGPFWEAGGFAGFIMVALLFNFILSRSLFRNKKSILLIIALLTTFSTSGFLALGILLFYNFWESNKTSTRLVGVSLIIIISIISYTQMHFLGKKIGEDIDISFSAPPANLERTRFVSAQLDIKNLSKNPIIGTGLGESDYSYTLKNMINHRNNGITKFARKFGIVIFILYFFSMYRSFLTLCFMNNIKASFSIFIMMTIMIIGFSENYFYKSFFISLVFLNFTYFESFPPLRVIKLNKLKLLRAIKKIY